MERPYRSHSIDQLEEAFDAAAGDRAIIAAISHELTFRRTQRARELAALIDRPQGNPGSAPRAAKPRIRANSPKDPRRPNHRPTAEQVEAVMAFTCGGTLKINAFAGTGKTSTLQLLADSTSRRGQYIAFNRSIVEDAKGKFPRTVNCATLHGLAFRATPSEFRSENKMTGTCNANQLAHVLGLGKNWRIDEHHTLQPRSQGYLILETVRRFAQSADPEPLPLHVPRHGSLLGASETTLKAVEEFALKGARHVWSRMATAADPLPLGHEGYLKLWALSEPRIAADYILLDEAQDTNPVVLATLRQQQAQMVYVGDRYQQIYEWRGAVNAMERIATDRETRLTKSFRFGSALAEAASRVLATLGECVSISGNESVTSRIGPTNPTTILARTNAGTIGAVIAALDDGHHPHLVGGTKDFMDLLRGVVDLKQGQPSEVPEFFGFSDWNSVVAFARSGEGPHLLTFVNLVESRGEKQLMWALRQTVEENESDLIISTAHKAKGREWPRVRLMDDFIPTPRRTTDQASRQIAPEDDQAETRLLYVAMTRAKEELEIPPPLAARFGIRCETRVCAPHPPPPAPARRPPPAQAPAPWQPPQDWKSTPPIQSPPRLPASPRPRANKGLLDWLFG
jgi:hypothetical protein